MAGPGLGAMVVDKERQGHTSHSHTQLLAHRNDICRLFSQHVAKVGWHTHIGASILSCP